MTDTDKEIADLERKRDAAWREFHYYDGRIFELKQKPLTEEEREASLKQCRNIGKNLEEAS